MTPDHTDPTSSDADERGVLDDATRTDTSALGFLGAATAQVSVSLPTSDEDDLADDDVIGDEVVLDDPEAEDEVEPAASPVVDAKAVAGVGTVETSETETAEAEIEVVEAEIEPADDEPETVPDVESESDVDAAPAAEAIPEAPAAEAAPVVAEPVVEAAAAASTTLDDVAGVDPVPEAAAVGSVADDAADALVHAVAPVDEEADVDETRAERAHAVERVRTRRPELNLASKRLNQFEADTESSDLLTPDRLLEPGRLSRPEPEGAWQHFVYSLSGGRINLGDGKRARARKELSTRIAAPLAGGARFVPVLSRKGGVGKTTITTLLGMALADARDDRIIAIDANPDRGTLAERITRHNGKTVRDLVRMKDSVSGYNDVSTIVARDETRLDVLASDADPQVSVAFSDDDYEDVAKLAAHYYSVVLTDTGTGIVHSVMGATLGLADQLVVVAGLSVDEARLASETLTWLESNGYAGKARNAVVVLNNARPGAPLVREDELEAHFRTRVRQVVRMPYDAAIGTGSAIVFHDLQPETREAARALAATVVEGLRTPAAAA
ncbi:MinD/ParA family protein [Microbacterium horticulturae]|uniref:MinD/ParA family protein n=1 Tax=Microbacterium horticulturae TaxID=3028316 RepID=A0ABY8C347_9MICO|nr:MinD/ParA family protein [Microbacterium sp. KACC 23027]WEG10142.1 MinD/ParA family protein [Microbacterium sp. KACC 23027]